MKASRGGLPVDVYDAFRDGSTTMGVRLLSLVPMDARGPELPSSSPRCVTRRGQTKNGPLIAILHSTLAVSGDAL
jgi:hypothetical protein